MRILEKETREIKDTVQNLLDNEQIFTGYYIEKELDKMGMRVTRTTISDLRTKKRSLEKASFETVSRLYHFARTHEDELNKR